MRRFLPVLFALVFCPILIAQQTSSPTTAGPQGSNASDQAAPVTPRPSVLHTLVDGTPVKLRMSQTMSSADAKTGQEVPFEVIEDITVDGVVVLPKGSTAIGTVTDANSKKSMGRAGKLDIAVSYARLADQEKVALRAVQDEKGGGHVGAMTGAMVATSIVFFPAAPLFLFVHGKDITIPQGTEVTAFVQGDMHLDMNKFVAAPPTAVAPAAASQAQAGILIESIPPGADIAVDGGFVGNTPTSISIAPGAHEVTLSKKGYADWTRKLNVTGGNVHLNAELEALPASAVSGEITPAPTPAQ